MAITSVNDLWGKKFIFNSKLRTYTENETDGRYSWDCLDVQYIGTGTAPAVPSSVKVTFSYPNGSIVGTPKANYSANMLMVINEGNYPQPCIYVDGASTYLTDSINRWSYGAPRFIEFSEQPKDWAFVENEYWVNWWNSSTTEVPVGLGLVETYEYLFRAIGDSIRAKTDITEEIAALSFPGEIRGIPNEVNGGGITPVGAISITSNGSYDVTTYATANVAVEAEIPEGYIKPEGEKAITTNGKHDITSFASVDVNVPIPEGYIVPTGNIVLGDNGDYDISAYATATVNVSGGGGGEGGNKLQEYIDIRKNASNLFSEFPGTDEQLAYFLGELDLTKCKALSSTFYNLLTVQNVPALNVPMAESLYSTFKQSTALKKIEGITTTNKLTALDSTFYNCGWLAEVPYFDTSGVTKWYQTFGYTPITSVPHYDTSAATSFKNVFYNCLKLQEIPLFNTSNVTDLTAAFYNCSSLTVIPALDLSKVTTYGSTYNQAFKGCTKLQSFLATGMKASFDLNSATQLEREALVVILNNLATVTSSQKLTLGATNLAKLTDEDKAIATNKGWTLA